MKKVLRTFGFLLVSALIMISFASCRDDDDPADNDFFAGTYKGSIAYTDGETTTSTEDGSVFVTKIASGTKYNFAFSNSIPDLNGVEFKQEGDNVLVSVGATATQFIRINANDLTIFYTKDGKTWTANCKR
jgi:hypothetical protein